MTAKPSQEVYPEVQPDKVEPANLTKPCSVLSEYSQGTPKLWQYW